MRKISFLLTGALAILASATASAQSEPSDEVKVPDYSGYILTPEAPHTPRINGAKIYGARPGSDFLYKVAATGDRPMTFSAENLPKGLKIDSGTGVITGKVKKAGTYNVTLKADQQPRRGDKGVQDRHRREDRADSSDGLEQLELLGQHGKP